MRIVFTVVLAIFGCRGFNQGFIYNPSTTLEKTVDKNHYGTEYIFIKNNLNEAVELEFELLSENIPSSWSVTGCTNLICYNYIPDKGTLGTKLPNEEWYLSLNISVNGQIGEGEVKFGLRSSNMSTIMDTLVFKIKVEETELIEIKPWIEIKYNENGMTVFTQNGIEAELTMFNLSGQIVLKSTLSTVSTFDLSHLTRGIYVIAVISSTGRKITQKIIL